MSAFTFRRGALTLPALALGTAPLAAAPGWRSAAPIPEEQAYHTLLHAYALGIRFYDTAPAYGHGLAETRLGRFIAQVPREDIGIATKVGFLVQADRLVRDYSADGVHKSVEFSLKRLGVSQIDLVHVHDADEHAQQVLDETFPALERLRSQGVIGAVGMGMNQWQVPRFLLEHAYFDCVMIAGRYTLLEQGAGPFFDECARRGVPVLAASIYNSGVLASGASSPHAAYNHGAAPPGVLARVQRLEHICRELGITLLEAASQFPFTHPAVRTIVAGFQSAEEITACVAALRRTLPADTWQQLQRAGFLDPNLNFPLAKAVLL
jgi:D-threo-aldose 1-dehydrogenase